MANAWTWEAAMQRIAGRNKKQKNPEAGRASGFYFIF
jgi:hypothetical protein